MSKWTSSFKREGKRLTKAILTLTAKKVCLTNPSSSTRSKIENWSKNSRQDLLDYQGQSSTKESMTQAPISLKFMRTMLRNDLQGKIAISVPMLRQLMEPKMTQVQKPLNLRNFWLGKSTDQSHLCVATRKKIFLL